MTRHIFRIAVTGGIGCGKSEVVQYGAERGIPVADADRFVHELYRDPVWLQRLTARWGMDLLDADGNLNRSRLGRVVFERPAELAWLNALVHPEIRRRLAAWCAAHPAVVWVEVPLLFESGWQSDFDAVIAVWSPEALCRERVRGRGWGAGEFDRRIAAQWSADRKLEVADWGILNLGSRTHLLEQCDKIIQYLIG